MLDCSYVRFYWRASFCSSITYAKFVFPDGGTRF